MMTVTLVMIMSVMIIIRMNIININFATTRSLDYLPLVSEIIFAFFEKFLSLVEYSLLFILECFEIYLCKSNCLLMLWTVARLTNILPR